MRQVADNLLGNAIKYTPTGGTITVSTDDNWSTWNTPDMRIGIPPAERSRLFRRFYRASTVLQNPASHRQTTRGQRQEWQGEAWRHYEAWLTMGELTLGRQPRGSQLLQAGGRYRRSGPSISFLEGRPIVNRSEGSGQERSSSFGR
ncbi:ATP-binding protein [Actinoplanes sp. NPDC049548]|uniref:ATP-binding protein n=1 Tax=Actinoplanes sp. NPDC049548 TaxID=3155152 RepID=UPI003440F89C